MLHVSYNQILGIQGLGPVSSSLNSEPIMSGSLVFLLYKRDYLCIPSCTFNIYIYCGQSFSAEPINITARHS